MKRLLPTNILVIFLVALLVWTSQGFYCSAYCSYFWDGGNYIPKCTDQTSSSCTKCDERFFTLSTGGQCVPHGLYNQSLVINDLNPASTSPGWSSLNGFTYFNLRSGLYDLVEFNADDRYYKTFTLPPHFAIRIRFFVLRVTSASFSFIYYLDDKSYSYPYNSFPSSQSLGFIVTGDLVSHEDSNLSVAFQATSFPFGQFVGVKQLIIFVSKCSPGCSKCSSAVSCASCGSGYLFEQQCYTLCPQKTYPDAVSLTCQSCAPECYNCYDPLITDCTQCVFQGRYQTFLYGTECHYICPLGYFPDYTTNTCQCPSQLYFIDAANINTCTACSIQCQTCFGSLRTQCNSCVSGYYLVYGTTWCSNTCPSDQYQNPFNNKCYPCAGVCSSCQNTSTTCIGCFFTNMKYLHLNKCLLSCPDGYQPNNISRTCDACAPYEYSFNNTCGLQCPTYYMASNESKSCIHLSQTNFTYSIQINNIQILFDGKTMQISVNFGQGLDTASIDWLLRQSYFNVAIKIGDKTSLLASTARRLQQITQPIYEGILTERILIASDYAVRGVSMRSNTFIFTIEVPSEFNFNLQFMIDFGLRLKNPSGIAYANTTLFYSIQSDPQLLRQYYMYSQKYFYNIALIPLIFLAFVLIFTRIKGTYQLVMEYFRMMQLIGLCVFAAYPFKSQIFYLLDGFNYFNMQFFPNLYDWFVPPFTDTWAISGYVFYYGDANFIRLVGSILIFIVVCFLALLVMKFLVKASPQNMGWSLKLCMDLAQIKILHSFWSSLIFTFGNTSSTNLVLYLSHIVSYFFMGFLIYRQLKLYQSTEEINWLFFWRLIATLLFAIAAFSKLIVFVLLFILSITAAALYYIRWPVNQCKQYKFGFSVDARNSIITIMPIMSIFVSGLVMFYQDQLTQEIQIIFVLLLVHLVMIVLLFTVVCLNYLQKEKAQMIQQLINAKSKALKNQYYQQINKSTKSMDFQFQDKQLYNNNFQNMSQMARKTGIQHRQNTQSYIIDDQPIQKKFKAESFSKQAQSEVERKELDQIGQMEVNQFQQ